MLPTALRLAWKKPKLIDNLKDPDNINLDEVMNELLVEGIDKFVQPFQSLMNSLEDKSVVAGLIG